MSTLLDNDGRTIKHVKNLGWLLRNANTAQTISVAAMPEGSDNQCRLTVYMDAPGTPNRCARYTTEFASARILWDWLRRPSMLRLPLRWGGLSYPAWERGDYPGEPLTS